MASYRFRVGEKGELVLQVMTAASEPDYYRQWGEKFKETWRDATVADIPVSDPFSSSQVVHWTASGPGKE